MIGQTISHFHILEKLGGGGMGVVYKAEDTKLKRTVALKFLPRGLEAQEPERARFLQEAQAASALNHSNVCTIYEISEHEGQQFIVMEYVDGKTLRQMVPVQKTQTAIDYAIQIGEALQEAHSKGIVHRDIKTDNIMVNTKNQIKVMDFGLAKLKGSLKLTKTSSTVGTLAYMAPEQIQGEPVDARSDIFSFGVVLYEMLTGHLPFRGEHEAAMVYSIVNEEPEPMQKYRPELSSDLAHIINRALEKDPEDRYQTVHDVVIELRRVKKGTSRVTRAPIAPRAAEEGPTVVSEAQRVSRVIEGKKPRRAFFWMGLIGVFILIMGIILITVLPSHAPRLNPKMSFRTLEIPFAEIGYLGFSRDGNWLSFSAPDANREWSIYFMNVAKGNPRRLITELFKGFGFTEVSPDGSEVLFDGLSDKRLYGIYVVSSLGGSSRRITEPGCCGRWRPDGQRIGYILAGHSETPSQSAKREFWTIKADGRDNRLEFVDSLSYVWGACSFDWSPDGGSIAWLKAFPDYSGDIFVRDLKSGKERQLTNYRKPISEIAWASNDQIFFTSNKSGNTNVCVVPASGGEATQITKGSGPDVAVRVSADGKRLLYLQHRQISHIWTADIDGANARQLTFDDQPLGMPAFSPDKKKISFLMEAADPLQLILHVYIMQSDGANRTQLIAGDALDYTPSWSPDGKYLTYGSFRPSDERVDSTRVYLIEVSNPGVPRLVGKGWFAFWIDTEKFVVIPWLPSTFSTLYSIQKSEPIEVGEDSTWQFPLHDGKHILIRDTRKGLAGWWLKSTDKGPGVARKQILSSEYLWYAWPSASFRYLLYRQANKEVWRVSIPEGKRERLPDILNGINPYFGSVQMSFDDQQLLYLKLRVDARLILIENVFE